MAVLPVPGLPIRTGLFVVAPDDRVELALLGGLGQVAAELLESLVLVLGVLVRDAVGAAHARDRLGDLVARRSDVDPRVVGEGEQQVLGGDVLVTEATGLVVGLVERLGGRVARGGHLGDVAAGGRNRVERFVGGTPHALRIGAGRAQYGHDDAALLLEQGDEQMLTFELRVAASAGDALGGGERLLGLDGEAIGLHKI
jgi:hypothetical protein